MRDNRHLLRARKLAALVSIVAVVLVQDDPSRAAPPGTGEPLHLVRGEVRRVSDVAGLKAAVEAANGQPGPATLLLADGIYTLDAPGLEIRRAGLVIRSASGKRDMVMVRGPDEGPTPRSATFSLFQPMTS